MRVFLALSFLLSNFLLGQTTVLAQFEELNGGRSTLIDLKPNFPQPGDKVEATLDSGGNNDLYGADITWLLDGKEVLSAKNNRSFGFTATEAGVSQNITAILQKPNAQAKEVVKIFTPLYLDIIFEPQTHVPSFYLGRPTASLGSVVNATAILSGRNTLSTDLVYKWEVGSSVIGQGTLRGQSKVSFTTPRGKYVLVRLEISDLFGNQIAERSVFLPSVTPKIEFYEVNSLFGTKQSPVDSPLTLIGNTATVLASPYFLDSRVYNDPDLLEWEIEGQTYENLEGNPYEITLQRNSFSGRTSLDIHVRDLEELSQGAKASMDINL